MSVEGTAGEYSDPAQAERLYKKVAWKLLPFLFIAYVVAYLDRVNIGFAAHRMQEDLGFSAAVYGLGAGIFFLGYVLFEVPSNLLLTKIGARKTIMRIMIGWGILSACTMLVKTPWQFYTLRFFIGAFEAGFFPGVLLYLTFWFPPRMRGAIIALFMSAIAIAGVIGAPLSGWLMGAMEGVNGWHGWQWMFLLEGMPAVVLGVVAAFLLIDGPADAKWLSDGERAQIVRDTAATGDQASRHSMKDVIGDPRIYALAAVYFAIACGIYILGFWLPGMVRGYGVENSLHIGLLTAIPYICGVIGMIVVSRHSDRTNERRWHVSGCMIVCAVALVISTFVSTDLVLGLTALSIASAGVFAAMPLFWTIPTRYLSGTAAAGGIALINSLALIGGFVSPTVMGLIKTNTGSTDMGMYFFAGVIVAGAFLLLKVIPEHLLREQAWVSELVNPAHDLSSPGSIIPRCSNMRRFRLPRW